MPSQPSNTRNQHTRKNPPHQLRNQRKNQLKIHPPLRKPDTQQTIKKMLQTNQIKPKPLAPTPEKPPILKPAKLLYNHYEETNLEQNPSMNQMKPDMDKKPVNRPNKTQNTTHETKPVNMKPKQDTKKKPNHDLTPKPKPAQISGPARKVKTTGLPISDLKTFLEKKKKERELKLTMKLNFKNPSPSNSSDSATISRPQDSLLLNAPTDEKSDNSEVIFERDQGSSAHNGEIQTMSGDLLLAQCSINLGEKPMM